MVSIASIRANRWRLLKGRSSLCAISCLAHIKQVRYLVVDRMLMRAPCMRKSCCNQNGQLMMPIAK